MFKKKKGPDANVQFVNERIDEATDWKVLRQVQINRAFYSGNQWISWDRVNKHVFVPDLRPGEKRYTYNKIKPAITTLLAKLTKNHVQLEVHPDTNDDDRIEVAKGGHKFLKYQWQKDDMESKTRRLKLHMLVDGFPALKVFADKRRGRSFETDDGKTMYTGEIVTLVKDQMSVKVDPSAESPEEIRWCVEESPVDVDEIYETYGKKVKPEDIHMRQTFELAFDSDVRRKYSNHAMVKEYWEWPSKKYPNGRKITVCGLVELDYTENPGENPWVFFPMIPVLGRAVADGIVKDLTTPQMSYNIKRTAEARILEEMGNPMWKIPKGSIDEGEEPTNDIGGIFYFTPVGASEPGRVEGSSIDGGWQNAMERDKSDMEDISGAHDISQGAMPKGNHTLGGLQLQVEQDETKLSIAVQSYEEGIQKWGEKVLRLVQKHFPEEQQLSIVGENGEIEAFSFAGADLSGDEVVDVVPGSSMPKLKAVQDEKIMMMYQAGLFNDPRTGAPDTRKVARLLGEGVASDYFDNSEAHENKAKMEERQWTHLFEDEETVQALIEYMQNMQIYQQNAQQMAQEGVDINQIGIQPPQLPVKLPIVREFYDHEIHLECHNRFRLSDLYDNLPPELQMIVDMHCEEHEQALAQPEIQAQMAQQEQQQQEMQLEQEKEQNELSLKREKLEIDRINAMSKLN